MRRSHLNLASLAIIVAGAISFTARPAAAEEPPACTERCVEGGCPANVAQYCNGLSGGSCTGTVCFDKGDDFNWCANPDRDGDVLCYNP